MGEQFRRWWPALRALLSVAIVLFVAWAFARDLSRLPPRREPVGYGWLALSAALHLVGLGLSGVFWLRLLRHMDADPPFYAGMRAYFVSQMGKYSPLKGLSLVMRIGLVNSPRTRPAAATQAALYEVMTTMAVGAAVALLLAGFVGPADAAGVDRAALFHREDASHDPTGAEAALFATLLLAATALPLTPWLFNRLAAAATRPFGVATPPPARGVHLAEGVAWVVPCWLLFGLALACGLQALPEASFGWTWGDLGWLTVCMAVAYVGGFLVPTPAGLGGREFLLTLFLAPFLIRHGAAEADARPVASLAVLLLRLAWTLGEVILAGCLYLVPPPRGAP